MNDVLLTNGELLAVKVNFLTLYLIKKQGIDKDSITLENREKKLAKIENKKSREYFTLKDKIESMQLEVASKMIHIILRSNGKMVTFEEALMLCPMDTEEIQKLIMSFKNEMEKVKKKEAMKM